MTDHRAFHFNYRRWVKITAFVIIPAVMISALLVYARLYGVRQALQELVRTQTQNQYALSIGHTDIHPQSLSFKFHNVTIERIGADTTSGIISARVPEFELRLGSFSSFFSKELDISQLSVVDPHLTILSGANRIERSKITQQVIELYPVIETILSRFNIQSLRVSQATLDFVQQNDDIFSIRYVDLTILDWRMRELSNTSQLKINIRKQNLNLGKANLNFSGIEYNYLERHLIFTDFSVSAADSTSGSNISVSGKALKLKNLDYEELYRNLRYNLKRAEIVEPVIEAKFQWKKGRRARDINRNIVTRMVRQSFGECNLDSAIITQARVHIELRQADDTLSIDLPRVDFRLHTFAVVKDSSNFQIGEMLVKLNGSAVSLPGNWSVELDEVLYDRHRDLTLNNIVIRNDADAPPAATLSTLRVRYFNLIALIFQRQFNAWTIHAEGGRVNLHSFMRSTGAGDSAVRSPDILVHALSLKDIHLTYQSGKYSFEVEGLSAHGSHLHTTEQGDVRYNLKSISANAATVHDRRTGMHASLSNIAFNGQKLHARRTIARKDSLTVVADNLETELPPQAGNISSLKYIRADRLSVQGRLPGKRSATTQAPKDFFTLGRMEVGTLEAKVVMERNELSFTARNMRTDALQLGSTTVWPHRVAAELSNVVLHNAETNVRVARLTVDYPRRLSATELNVSGPKYKVSASSAVVRRPDVQKNFSLERLSLKNAQIVAGSRSLKADSITVASAVLEKDDPRAERVDIFKPTFAVGESTGPASNTQFRLLDAMPARHVYVHPGAITFSGDRTVAFGLVHADREKRTIRVSFLSTSLTKSTLTARNISLEPNRLSLDSVLVIPNKKWYSSLEVEETQILAKLARVTILRFSLDGAVSKRAVKNLDVTVGHAEFDLRRNKLLPDPPPNRKPVTLDGLIPLPEGIQVSGVNIQDGHIQYRQISDRTGEEGFIMMDKLVATALFDSLSSFISLRARTHLYQSGIVDLDYKTLGRDNFRLDIHVRDMDLTRLNQIIMPLQSLRIKSGHLREYKLSVHADDDMATGDASISYDGLHLELFKHNEPERKSLGTEVLTLLADGIILKHARENAQAPVSHVRVKHKSVFHYWVGSAISGATTSIRKGKKVKHKQK